MYLSRSVLWSPHQLLRQQAPWTRCRSVQCFAPSFLRNPIHDRWCLLALVLDILRSQTLLYTVQNDARRVPDVSLPPLMSPRTPARRRKDQKQRSPSLRFDNRLVEQPTTTTNDSNNNSKEQQNNNNNKRS